MNANNINNAYDSSQDEHAKAWELLPWLANGTLDQWSKSSVERHASECVACRRELELLRGISEATRGVDHQPLSPERSLGAMMERIDSEESARLGARWMAALSERFQLPRPALVAIQAIALLLVGGALGWIWSAGQEPSFQTLSDPAESAAASQSRIRVVFDDRVSIAEMREILEEVDGHMVDGPSPHGVYTVEIEPAPGEAVEVSAVIERLRTHEGVRFAEPVGEGSSERRP